MRSDGIAKAGRVAWPERRSPARGAPRVRRGPANQTEGLPTRHRLKAVGSLARLKAPEARHERLIAS